MKSLLAMGDAGNALAPGTTYYNIVQGVQSNDTTENDRKQLVAAAGTISDFYIKLGVAPGAGKSTTATLRVNGADTSAVVTISDTDTSGTSNEEVSVSAGDEVCWKILVESGGTNPLHWEGACVFEGDDDSQAIWCGHGTGMSAGNERTFGVTGWNSSVAVGAVYDVVCSEAGTIKNLYVELPSGPGAGKSIDFTLYKNGVAQSLTCTISNTDTTGNDTSNTVSVAAGDKLMLSTDPDAGSTIGEVYYGMVIEPTTEGNYPMPGMNSSFPDTVVNQYGNILGFNAGFAADNAIHGVAVMKGTLKNFYYSIKTAPGAGNHWDFTVQKNDTNTDLTVAINNSDTTGSDTSNTVEVEDGDIVRLQSDPDSNPSSSGLNANGLTWVGYESTATQITGSVVII